MPAHEPSDLAADLEALLRTHGAALFGVADLAGLPEDLTRGLPRGVAVARRLDPAVIDDLAAGPTDAYAREYEQANADVNAITAAGAEFLRGRGFRAEIEPATLESLDPDNLRAPLQHKTLARLAGLGWIGRCALLVTPEHGSAVRFGSILTDALLPTGDPAEESRCGPCRICVEICPGGAPVGPEYGPGMAREEVFDARACYDTIRRLGRERGLTRAVCGMCIANCPWTRRFVDANRPA